MPSRLISLFSSCLILSMLVLVQFSRAQGSLATQIAGPIFQAAPAYGSGGQKAASIVLADVNGDGKPDLLVANQCNDSICTTVSVSVLLGNGDGTFQPAMTYNSGGYNSSSLAVGDVNGDGNLDLVVTSNCANSGSCQNGIIGVLLGNGDGTFQNAVTYNSGGMHAGFIVLSDVNGDGKPDLLVANQCDASTCTQGSVSVLLGNGDGTFQAPASYSSGGYTAFSLAVADVNGDGKQDLIVANQCASASGCPYATNGSIGVLLGNGDGSFQSAVNYNSGGYYAVAMVVQDVNGDGKPDLLVSNVCDNLYCNTGMNGRIGVLMGNGDGTFRAAVTYGSGTPLFARSLAVGDINGDGNEDLLVGTTGVNGSVGVLLGNGDGTFQPAVTFYDSGGQVAGSLAIGDINGDGKEDVLVANWCSFDSNQSCGNPNGSLGVLLGNGDGTFLGAVTYNVGGAGLGFLAVGDVNGDGNQDLVFPNGILLGNGKGGFQRGVSYASGGIYPSSAVLADVNGDGKPDLIVSTEYSDSTYMNGGLSVLLGIGDGTFQPAAIYASGGNIALGVAVGDVNGDGKPDLVSINQCGNNGDCSDGSIGVLLGNGDGTFQTATSYDSGGDHSYSLALADVNGDGKLDVIVTIECASGGCLNGGLVGVLLGNGDGTFQNAVLYGTGGYAAYSVAVGDVNGDGKLDLVVGNLCAITSNCYVGASGGVSVLLGNGDGTFQAPIITSTPPFHNSSGKLVLADFDGDGKLDVASADGDFLLLGKGDGTFQSPLSLGSSGVAIALGDFNNDGKPDLAVGGVTILLNIARNTAVSLVSSNNPSIFGQVVVFTANLTQKVSGTPTGTVTFMDGMATLGTIPLANGSAVLSTSAPKGGSHTITANYSGNWRFSPSTSPPLVQTVRRASSTTLVLSSLNPSAYGQPISLSATATPVDGSSATGTITFSDGATVLGTANLNANTASLVGITLNAGSHAITATYGGDDNVLGSTSAVLVQVVNGVTTTTSLSSSASPVAPNQPVTYTATVTSAAGLRHEMKSASISDSFG